MNPKLRLVTPRPLRQAGRVAIGVLAGVVLAVAAAGFGYRAMQAEPAPAVTYSLIDGAKLSQQQLRGKVVLINFWATSCVSCVVDMQTLADTHRRFHDRGFETVAVAMSYDRPDYVLHFASTRKLPFPVALDLNGEAAAAYGDVAVTPSSFLIGKDGRIVMRWVGEPDMATLNKLIEAELVKPT